MAIKSLTILLLIGYASAFILPGRETGRIGVHGGTPIGIGKVPFMAHYRPKVKNTPVFCGASIVHDRFLITAAHCVGIAEFMDYENLMYVTVGTDKWKRGKDYAIEKTFVHPGFQLDFKEVSFDYDIAILKLNRSIEFDDEVQPIKMADPNFKLQEGDLITGMGFGMTERGKASQTLLSVELPYVNQEKCIKIYDNAGYNITSNMFCAGLEKPVGTCQGDSGGPATFDSILVGVTSWGKGCASLEFPDVYTRISALRPYIDDIIKSNS